MDLNIFFLKWVSGGTVDIGETPLKISRGKAVTASETTLVTEKNL